MNTKTMGRAATVAAALCLSLPCLGQYKPSDRDPNKDKRDTIWLESGKALRGRILTPHDPEQVTLQIGGSTKRVPRKSIARTESVQDNLVELLDRRLKHFDQPRLRLFVAEWARSKHLDEMAVLIATELVLEDPTDAAAHEFLGHRKHKELWRWPHEGKWLTIEQLERSIFDWKNALTLDSEHWQLETNAGLLEGVRALFDLEHLYVFWHDTYGEGLQLKEALTGPGSQIGKMAIRARHNDTEFPQWGQMARPYFAPNHVGNSLGNVSETYYPALQPTRPEGLLFLGTQGILYRCLMDNPTVQTSRDRICAWLEVGLGRYSEQAMQGEAGFAVGQLPALPDQVDSLNGLAWPGSIENLIHLPMYMGFYAREQYVTDTNWGAASSFCLYMLQHPDKEVRVGFVKYIRKALADGGGDSSSIFDQMVGRKIETFKKSWRDFATKVSGIGR